MRPTASGVWRAPRPRVVRALVVVLVAAAFAFVTPALADPFGYVVNHGDGTVSVLDTAANHVVTTVTVGSEPLGAAVHPSGTRVYVTNQVAVSGTVSVIDTAVNGVVTTVTVGGRPSGVAVKLPGDRVYVTNRDDKTVSVIDTATNQVVGVPIGVGNNPLGIAIDPSGSPAYVVNKGTNDVSVIDTVQNKVIGTIPVGNDPSQVAVSPNGLRVYVSNNSNSSVSVIDAGAGAVVKTIPVGNSPEGLAIDPTGAWLYVANSGPNSVSVINTANNLVATTIKVGFTPFSLALRPDAARLFVANRQSGTVSVIDTSSNAVSTTVPVGLGPSGMGQFIVPSLRTPVFGAAARKCQAALSRQAEKLATVHHALEATCRLGRIKAEAAGKGTAKADAACEKALDPADPASKLFRARVKFRAAVERACGKVLPADVNAPCARGAVGFGSTADCVITQHGGRVENMIADEFSAARPVPLGGAAVACERAIATNGRRFTDRLHKDLGKCLEKLLTAAATGKDEGKVITACFAKLDLGSAVSKASVARDTARLKIAQKCAGVAPADLGSPCSPDAADLAAVVNCVVGDHANDVARLVGAEFNDACVTLTRIGLATRYPGVCSGGE